MTTSDTSVTSICVGANAIPPSTCTGGLQSGPIVANLAITLPSFTPGVTTNKLYSSGGTLFWNGLALATGGSVGPGTTGVIPVFTAANAIGNSIMSQTGTVITLAGTLQATGFGTSAFTSAGVGTNTLEVRNTAAGVANFARLGAQSDIVGATLDAYSSTFTSSGFQVQASALLASNGVGGLSLAAVAGAGVIRFYTGGSGTPRGQITAAGLWSWETFGSHQFAAGGTGFNTLSVANPTAGAGNGAGLLVNSDTVSAQLLTQSSTFTTAGIQVQAGSTLFSNGSGGFSIATTHASGALRFYTQGIQRWGINAAGDHTFGAAANIADSSGTPTINAGCGGAGVSVVGADYAFTVALGAAPGTPGPCTVNFGHAYSIAPVCVAVRNDGTGTPTFSASSTTTTVSIWASGSMAVGNTINVHCKGY